jgi:hypothetical protein
MKIGLRLLEFEALALRLGQKLFKVAKGDGHAGGLSIRV